MTVYRFQRRSWLLMGVVLLVATVLRFGDGGATAHFRFDEAQLSLLAMQMADGSAFPLVGIESSAGVPNSPVTVYFLLLPFLLTDNPLLVTLFVAAWNVLGVALLWSIAHRYFGLLVAVLAGLLYAVNPHAITYSRSIWAQNFHTPIILGALWLAILGFWEGKRWAQALALPIFLLGFQIHFAAWTLLPIYLWVAWQGRSNVSWRRLAISLALGLLTLLPFALGISQQPEGAVERSNTIFGILGDGLRLRWYPVNQVLDLATGVGFNAFPETEIPALLAVLWRGIGLFALVGLAVAWYKGKRSWAVLLSLWAGFTLVSFIPAWTGSGVFRHYFIPSIPAFSLLTALGFIAVIHLVQRRWPSRAHAVVYGAYGLALLALASQAGLVIDTYTDRLNTYSFNAASGRTSTPLSYLLDVRAVLQEYDDILLLGANPHESNYYVWEPLLYNSASCVRDLLILDGTVDVLPAGRFAAVVAPSTSSNGDFSVPERYRHDNPIRVPLRPGERPYTIYPFDEAPPWEEAPVVPLESVIFENGVRLTGYYLTPDSLQLHWKVDQAPGGGYQYFGHFLNADGEKLGQRDAPFYVGQHWCKGDTIITTTAINLPVDTEMLRVGMYSLDAGGGITNQAIVNSAGAALGTWIDITLADDLRASS